MIHYSPTSLQQVIDWRIKRFPVYRILDDERWMENFFESGEIQLSSFTKFHSYKDELQGDVQEGNATVIFEGGDGNTHAMVYEAGLNAFVLSTTTTLNDQVIKDFKGKCAIKINHPTMFALEIAKKLPFVTSGLEGDCDYVEYRSEFIERSLSTDNLLKAVKDLDKPQMQSLVTDLTRGMEIFAKHLKYAHQKEYRFVWFSDLPVNSTIRINCPEATMFCEKVTL